MVLCRGVDSISSYSHQWSDGLYVCMIRGSCSLDILN